MDFQKPPLQKLKDNLFEEKQLNIYVLRLDLIHPFISGNKWYKLKYNLEEFHRLGKEYLVTFGGAFSNHIVATAAAGKEFGIKTIGIIRGEELNKNSNAVLQFASACGMELVFVSREEYRRLKASDEKVRGKITSDIFILPEGGSNEFALQGCTEIVKEIHTPFDCILSACGTGMTLAGIAKSISSHQEIIGISVLHGENFLEKNISEWSGNNHFKMIYDYHFGGYARVNDELKTFCNTFYYQQQIRIEPVYTGKLFFGLYDLIKKDSFKQGKTIVAIHSGGVFDFSIKPS
jgi:1-aminocyclopropane-1-carboxylate deaminase/D-cysteine desulfhydrase-like pyridoxal-dependent ACC family enzyme